jgi:hypothetical protein
MGESGASENITLTKQGNRFVIKQDSRFVSRRR